jgi:signal peptidase II
LQQEQANQARAMKAVPANRYIVFFSIAIAGCIIDLATKSWVFGLLCRLRPDGGEFWIWEGVFGLQASVNTGALFGMFEGMVAVFAGLSIVAALGIFFWLFCAGAARDWLLTMALGCVTAGIFGNLYDRLGLPGLVEDGQPVRAVRDWILVMIGDWPWPTFNIADSMLVCGALMLVWHAMRQDSRGAAV